MHTTNRKSAFLSLSLLLLRRLRPSRRFYSSHDVAARVRVCVFFPRFDTARMACLWHTSPTLPHSMTLILSTVVVVVVNTRCVRVCMLMYTHVIQAHMRAKASYSIRSALPARARMLRMYLCVLYVVFCALRRLVSISKRYYSTKKKNENCSRVPRRTRFVSTRRKDDGGGARRLAGDGRSKRAPTYIYVCILYTYGRTGYAFDFWDTEMGNGL